MQNKNYKIVDKFKYLILISIVFIVVGIIMTFVRGVALDINFKGGTTISYNYEGELDFKDVEAVAKDALSKYNTTNYINFSYIGDLNFGDVEDTVQGVFTNNEAVTVEAGKESFRVAVVTDKEISDEAIQNVAEKLAQNYVGNKITVGELSTSVREVQLTLNESTDYTTGAKSVVISVIGNTALSKTEIDAVTNALTADDSDNVEEVTDGSVETKSDAVSGISFKDNKIELSSSNSVGATVGLSFFTKSLYALLIASILVAIYVGIRFRNIGGIFAAITALIALVHDVIIVFFTDVIFGLTIDTYFIAVVLTILGYSLNDTIVVYDRVRENMTLRDEGYSMRDVVNISISQSCKRTIVTSITTIAAIMSINVVALIMGLDSILGFSIPMTVGLIAGSFSSLCIAGPLYVFWVEFKEKKGIGKKAKKEDKLSYVNRKNPKKK